MTIPEAAQRRLDEDAEVWLTTVGDSGAPVPYPVWFVQDGDDVVVFTKPTARRVHNISRRPVVSLHFNSDPHGGDVWIITGPAAVTHRVKPSGAPGYLAKYRTAIEQELSTTVEDVDATYDAEIRIRIASVRTV